MRVVFVLLAVLALAIAWLAARLQKALTDSTKRPPAMRYIKYAFLVTAAALAFQAFRT